MDPLSPLDGDDRIEITAGTLHLRSWDPADGPLPTAAVAGGGRAGTLFAFGVHHATTGALLGAVTLHRPHGAGPAEAGCWVDPAHEDQADPVGPRAVGSLSRWAVAVLGVPDVVVQGTGTSH